MRSDEQDAGYYVRSIGQLSRWPSVGDEFENIKQLQADAITAELRTRGNRLSWWKINNLEKHTVTEMVASMISICDEKPNGIIHVVAVPCEVLNDEIKMDKSLSGAKTAMEEMMHRHYDSIDMTCEDIGKVAEIIAKGCIGDRSDALVVDIYRDEALEYIKNRYEAGLLNLDVVGNWARTQINLPYRIDVSLDTFKRIKDGAKCIELQLYDNKHKKINIGDKIIFCSDNKVIHVEVVGLSRYPNFKELLDDYGTAFLTSENTDKKELEKELTKVFPLRRQNKNGVLGIKFKVE